MSSCVSIPRTRAHSFPTKAVNIWLQTDDLEHVYVVGSYFHYAGGFKPPSAVEVSPNQDTTPWAG